jgi:hypothetical protein
MYTYHVAGSLSRSSAIRLKRPLGAMVLLEGVVVERKDVDSIVWREPSQYSLAPSSTAKGPAPYFVPAAASRPPPQAHAMAESTLVPTW